ncbi:MAG: AAA family ATPase [Nanoarchaeota archaeon]
MILKKLVIENLRSYKYQEIIFPKGAILLSGDVGSGKTTILLAIEFALFGLQPSQKASAILRNDAETGRVILNFEVEDKNVIIERTLKRSKKSISQEYVNLIINNEKFEESITEIKTKILKLLNYPSEFAKKTNLLYKFTVYTPQEEMKQIVLESKEVRLNILRHVFGIDKYKRIQENTNILRLRLREKIRINEALLQNLDKIKDNLKEKKILLVKLKENKKKSEEGFDNKFGTRILKERSVKEIQDKINEKKSLETEKDKSNILILEKKQQISNYDKNLAFIEQEINELSKFKLNETEYGSLVRMIEFQKNKNEEIQKEYVEIIGNLRSLESKKSETDTLIKKISGLEKCPTCLQQVSELYKNIILENARKEIDYINTKILQHDKTKKESISKIEKIKDEINSFNKKKTEMEGLKIKLENAKEKFNRVKDIKLQKKSLERDVSLLNDQVSRIEKIIKDYEKYDKIFENRTKELEEAKREENKAAIIKAEINKEIQFLEQQINEKREEVKEKSKLKNQTEKIKNLEFWVSEKFLNIILSTEKSVMITLRQEFSNIFSKWFSVLVSDSLIAKLDDDFSPKIEHRDYELEYSFLSGGERTAIALAYRLALNQIINSLLSNIKTSKIVILDEPTDGFSAQQLEKMGEVLEQLDTEQLILVSHEQKMEDFVDNIIRIRKENNVSWVA